MVTEEDYASNDGDNKSEASFAEGGSDIVQQQIVPEETGRSKSNLLHVLKTIKNFLAIFRSQPLHHDKSTA